MTLHAVVPEELSGFGRTLKAQVDAVNAMIAAIDGPLNSITWNGPAKERFLSEWNGDFRTALNRLNAAFEAAGTDCEQRAEGARIALGVG